MLLTLVATGLLAGGAALAHDTLHVRALTKPPRLDGRVALGEYGDSPTLLPTSGGTVQLFMGHAAGWVYLVAILPDSTSYWGDDLVISLDPDGSGGPAPGPGDRQWYLRRVLDSSLVATSPGGRWFAPGTVPHALRSAHQGHDWEVASTTDAGGWHVELRIQDSVFRGRQALPRLAFRTYNDAPAGWWSWPTPSGALRPQGVEQVPDLWIPTVLD